MQAKSLAKLSGFMQSCHQFWKIPSNFWCEPVCGKILSRFAEVLWEYMWECLRSFCESIYENRFIMIMTRASKKKCIYSLPKWSIRLRFYSLLFITINVRKFHFIRFLFLMSINENQFYSLSNFIRFFFEALIMTLGSFCLMESQAMSAPLKKETSLKKHF